MKKGSKSIKCFNCGCVVGWRVPIGETAGYPLVEIQLSENTIKQEKGFCVKYFCSECYSK